MRHGTVYAYRELKCRCPECKGAIAKKQAKKKARMKQKTTDNGGIAPVESHGLSTATNWGCRCPVCAAAQASRNKVYGLTKVAADSRERVRKRHYQESLETASRTGMQWTGAELEVVARAELTAREAARLTHRTVYAVRRMRTRLSSGDPRLNNQVS